jgi:hypothetical protein
VVVDVDYAAYSPAIRGAGLTVPGIELRLPTPTDTFDTSSISE